MVRLTELQCKKAIRALEKRYGKSTMPYRFSYVEGLGYRCMDVETFAYIQFRITLTGRLKVFAEHDGPY